MSDLKQIADKTHERMADTYGWDAKVAVLEAALRAAVDAQRQADAAIARAHHVRGFHLAHRIAEAIEAGRTDK